MSKEKAFELGLTMYQDPWLCRTIKNPENILQTAGEKGLRLAAHEILTDDHFKLNYFPQLLKLAGNEQGAKNLLRPVIDGYISGLMSTIQEEPIEV